MTKYSPQRAGVRLSDSAGIGAGTASESSPGSPANCLGVPAFLWACAQQPDRTGFFLVNRIKHGLELCMSSFFSSFWGSSTIRFFTSIQSHQESENPLFLTSSLVSSHCLTQLLHKSHEIALGMRSGQGSHSASRPSTHKAARWYK